MDLRKSHKIGQSVLEYMLIMTVVAVVIFLAIKPSSTPSVLNKAQTQSEIYYNTIAEGIMGRNPQPINGGWCPAKPTGERECACPQPAFGGAPCAAPSASIAYCGDGTCGAGETAEPGHPINGSDPLSTCYEDCGFSPNCSQCVTLVPSASCGTACGAGVCSSTQVCMVSDCPTSCAGYNETCQDDAALCSGSCSCDPTQWTPVGACGATVGACTPTALQKCFQNNSCSAACTASQTVRAFSDPECGKCTATTIPITCGPTGTIPFPDTDNGVKASAVCPFGCTASTMEALCVNGSFVVDTKTVCFPAACLATNYDTGVCGNVTLPITSPGNSTPDIPCRTGCSGIVKADCPTGTATFNVTTNTCVPNNCTPAPYATAFCGSVTLPATNHGNTGTAPCPGGCSGTGITAQCSFGNFINFTDGCFADCPALPVSAGACGSGSIPVTQSGQTGLWDCGACSGTATAVCNNGVWGAVTSTCGCLDTAVAAGACGTATLPAVDNGLPTSTICPGACTGTVSGTCSNGTVSGVSNTCLLDCPALPVSAGACGSGSLPVTQSGQVGTWDCGACSGTMSATCNNGSWSSVTNDCGCLSTNVATACGTQILPAAADNTPQALACPGSCAGSVTALCADGDYVNINSTCLPNCPALDVIAGGCGSAQIPVTQSGQTGQVSCPGGCSGNLSSLCIGGTWQGVTNDCGCLSRSTSAGGCGSGTLPAVANGQTSSWDCGPCSGTVDAVCSQGTLGAESNSCGCLAQSVPHAGCDPILPASSNGQFQSTTCQCGCVGAATGTCSQGSWSGVSDGCQLAYSADFIVAADPNPFPGSPTVTTNNQSFMMCFASSISSASLSGAGCGVPSATCTIVAQ